MDNFFRYFNMREGFSQLLGSSGNATANTTSESSSETKAQGGTIQRNVVRADNRMTAQKVSTAYACIRILSDAVAGLQCQYQRWSEPLRQYVNCDETLGGRMGVDSKLFYLLTVRPNKRLTAFQFWKNVVSEMLLRGNAYAMFRYNADGDPEELLLLDGVSYTKDTDTYDVNDSVNKVYGRYSSDEILHFKNVSLDGGYSGVATIYFAAVQLNIASTASVDTLDTFARGGMGKYLYHQPDEAKNFTTMTDEQMNDVVNDIQDQLNEKNDIIISRGSGKLEAMQMDSQQQQFLSKQEFTVKEIARYFGVPLGKLDEPGSSNYKSVDEANLQLYSEGLRPLCTNIEQELCAKLIPWERSTTYRFRFDTAPLYLTDPTTRENYIQKCLGNGTMTVNEAREYKNLSPVKGGDKTLVSANLLPIDGQKFQSAKALGKKQGNGNNGNNSNNNNNNNITDNSNE